MATNPNIAALLAQAQGGVPQGVPAGALPGAINPAALQARQTALNAPSVAAVPAGGIPPGWQAALGQVGQAAAANPQASLQGMAPGAGLQNQALQSQLGAALSPQAIQNGAGILAGRRPLIRS